MASSACPPSPLKPLNPLPAMVVICVNALDEYTNDGSQGGCEVGEVGSELGCPVGVDGL